MCIRDRHENILSGFSCLLPTGRPINEDEITQFIELCRFYSYDLAPYSDSFLKSSIQLWHHKFCGQNTAIPKNAISALQLCDEISFGPVNTLLRIFCTIPVTTSTAERSFSTLRRLKTYLRNTMGQTRLNGLALLNIHRQLGVTSDEVVNILARNPRKLNFVL